MAPRICIALPVKDGSAFIRETLDSVLAQEGADFEVRVRDNGSSDETVAIAEEYAGRDPRVSVAVNEEDIGPYGSMNRILADTDAEWYVPFAADDVMAPGNLAAKLAALEEADATFAHSSALLIDADGNPGEIAPNHANTPRVADPPSFFAQIAPNNMISTQSVLVRSDVLRSVGGFDARPHYASDWLTWMRLALRERVVTLAEPLISNRIHASSGTTTLSAQGINGSHIPAVLDAIFEDDAMPPAWLDRRDEMTASNLVNVAHVLHRDGVRRVRQGWAGYMTVGRALARLPADAGLRNTYLAYVEQSGLTPPRLPFEAVAAAPETDEDAAALGGLVEQLGPLLGALAIAAAPERVDEAMGLLEPYFGDAELDVSIVPTERPADLLLPGRLALARWGSDFVGDAEDAGLPVQPYAMPDPLAQPASAAKWGILDASLALAAR